MYLVDYHHWEDFNSLGICWSHAEAGEEGETDGWIQITDKAKQWLDERFPDWEES